MKKGTPRHHKMFDLASRLKVPVPMAVGILEMLWQFVGESCPQGDIGRVPDKNIATAVGWEKKSGLLIDSLCDSRWLDRDETHRLIVHDWPDHAEYDVCRKLMRMKKDFLEIYGVSVRDRRAPDTEVTRKLPDKDALKSASREAKAKGSGALLEDFEEFRKACIECNLSFSDSDMSDSKWIWNRMDFEQKALAIQGLFDRRDCGEFDDAEFRPLPQNYLSKKIWQRTLRTKGALKPSMLEGL